MQADVEEQGRAKNDRLSNLNVRLAAAAEAGMDGSGNITDLGDLQVMCTLSRCCRQLVAIPVATVLL